MIRWSQGAALPGQTCWTLEPGPKDIQQGKLHACLAVPVGLEGAEVLSWPRHLPPNNEALSLQEGSIISLVSPCLETFHVHNITFSLQFSKFNGLPFAIKRHHGTKKINFGFLLPTQNFPQMRLQRNQLSSHKSIHFQEHKE